MAEGKNRNLSGDYTDSQNFDAYSPENQQYLRDHSQSTVDGVPVDNVDNKEDGFFGGFRKRKDSEGNTKWGIGRDDLKDAEASASKDPNASGRGGDKSATLGEKEKNIEGDNTSGGKFKNAVKGAEALKSGNVVKAAGILKKGGPLVAILALILTFAGVSFLGQMAMPFSLVSQLQGNFDSISVSQNIRSRSFLRWQTARNDTVHDCIKAHYFKSDEFKVTNRQRSKLANHGITFEDEDGITVMKFKGSDGKTRTIVADSSQAGEGRQTFQQAFDSDPEFNSNYSKGASTWRGSVKAWFDSGAEKILAKLGVKRGVWRDFKSGKSQEEGMDNMRSTIAGESDVDSVNGKASSSATETTETRNSSGETEIRTEIDSGEMEDVSLARSDIQTDANGRVTNVDGVKTKLKGIADGIGKIKGLANTATGIYCGISDFVGAVSAMVAAYQTMQIVGVASNFFEGIQKAQIGDGDSAPLHELMNSLTQKTTKTYTQVKTVSQAANFDEENPEYETEEESVTNTRSAMEAEAINALYAGRAVNVNDPSVKSYNTSAFSRDLFSGLASVLNYVDISMSSFRSCTIARLAAAGVNIAMDGGMLALCIGTAGIGCLVDAAIEESASIIFSAAFAMAVSVAISFFTPHIVDVLTRSIATDVMGEDLGNALVSGANTYMGGNARGNGQSLTNKEGFTSYLLERDRVIAEEANFERNNKSPFDITSQYTFMGSLAKQMATLSTGSSSLMKTLNSASSVVGNAFSSLTPRSSAVSAGIEAQAASDNTEKYCPDIADIGAVADAFCNPYITTDTSTMNEHPADIVNSISDGLETDSDGNPVVKEDSGLAKYIIFCGQRSSPFGLADQNIAASVDSTSSMNTATSSILGAIPIVGDGLDIVSNEQKLNNFAWISGEACVAGNNNSSSFVPTWGETKKYQRFIEDQRLAEAEGIIEESAVSKYIASYYEKSPIDASFEGTLARYSGLTKETVELTIAMLELSEWAADYSPSNYAPYSESDNNTFEVKRQILFDEEKTSENYNVAVLLYSYVDSRRFNYDYSA